jgi:VWFA-related protein
MATVIVVAAQAAQAQQTAPPVFRAGVELVTLPVIVVDRDGRPARGLSAEDFVVRLAGKPRPVRTVAFVETSAPRVAAAPVGGRETTNTGPDRPTITSETRPRLLVLVFDDLSFRFTSGELLALKGAVERVLAKTGVEDQIGLVTTTGRVLVNPTKDRGAIASALRRVSGFYDDSQPDVFIAVEEAGAITREGGEGQGLVTVAVEDRECSILAGGQDWRKDRASAWCPPTIQSTARLVIGDAISRTASQLRVLLETVRVLGRAPGPKTLVVVSDGLATSETFAASGLSAFAAAAAEGGIQVYAVTGMPDGTQIGEPHASRARARAKEHEWLQNGVDDLAGAAGAPRFRAVGRPEAVFDRILSETSGYYVLGVDAPDVPAGRTPLASVSVRTAGLTVRTHKNAIVRSVKPEVVTTEQQLQRALLEGTSWFDVPVTVATSVRRAPNGSQVELGINLMVPAEIPAPLSVGFAVVDKAGRVQKSGMVRVPAVEGAADHRTSFASEVPAGEFRLRIAVADAAGALGSVELPVRARLNAAGRFYTSELQTFSVDAAGRRRFLALERIPDSATHVGVALELYNAGAGELQEPLPLVRLDVNRVGTTVPVASQTITPVAVERVLRAQAFVVLAGLDPGTYALTTTILDNGAPVAVLSTTVRKVAVDAGAAAGAGAGAGPAGATVVPPASRPSADVVREAIRGDAGIRRAFDVAPLLAVADRHATRVREDSAAAVPPFNEGIARLRAGDARAAMLALEATAIHAPSSTSVLLYLGVAHALMGRDREAAGAWQMGLMGDGVEDVWVVTLVDAMVRLGEESEADIVLTEGLGRFPSSALLQRRRLDRLLAAGRFAEARALVDRLVGANRDDDGLLFWQVSLAFADALAPGAPARAIEEFRALAGAYVAAGRPRAATVAGWAAGFGRLAGAVSEEYLRTFVAATLSQRTGTW